jgi:ketosteroid isomerase-like protein
MKSTKQVLEHHQKSLKQGDLNEVMSDYAPAAVLFTKDGILKGSEAIGRMFETFIAEFAKPGTTLNRKQQLLDGDYAYVVWTAETTANVYEIGTDTFVIREGKIAAQSFTAKVTPKT